MHNPDHRLRPVTWTVMQSVLGVDKAKRTAPHHNVLAILSRGGFRRLFTVRLLSQLGDGWFQAALAGSVLFNPEQSTSPIAITAAFAILLLPYSVVAPFVGVFLDRWSRRNSLGVANLIRGAAVVPAAISVWYGREDSMFLAAALAVVALNRFFISGISASQPHVVEAERLVTANSFATTAGTVVYATGLAAAGFAIQLLRPSPHHYAAIALVAAGAYCASGLLTFAWFRPEALGPDDAVRTTRSIVAGLRETAAGMVSGFHHLAHRPAARAIVLAQAAHRALFGVLAITTLLLYRNYYAAGDAGASIAGLLPVAAAAAAGAMLAALVTPRMTRVIGAGRWLVIVTASLAVLVPACGLAYVPALTVAAAFVANLGGQATKIITETSIQLDIEDDYRGRVFSINDTGFNLMFVLGLLIGSLALPMTGVSPPTMVAVGVGYALVAFGFGLANRRLTQATDPAVAPR
jgi:MFS family permease